MKSRIMIISIILMSIVIIMANYVRIAKVSINVIDENREPVKDASVEIYLYRADPNNIISKGNTDVKGTFSKTGYSANGVVGGVVKKEQYYYSTFHHDFFVKKNGFWQPWNKKIQVTLRPVINPVPMYVRRHAYLMPALGKNIGFDLEKSDWIFPYGNGTHSDFVFRIDRQYKDVDNFDATLTISFSNEYDGIQLIKEDPGGDFSVGSKFRLPRHAPEDGYKSVFAKRMSTGTFGLRQHANIEGNNYIFRVRSETENGKLKRAMYGKIRGDIKFAAGSDKANFEMIYYLNPDYSRNLEFDPKRNLFILPEGERIGMP